MTRSIASRRLFDFVSLVSAIAKGNFWKDAKLRGRNSALRSLGRLRYGISVARQSVCQKRFPNNVSGEVKRRVILRGA